MNLQTFSIMNKIMSLFVKYNRKVNMSSVVSVTQNTEQRSPLHFNNTTTFVQRCTHT